MPRFTATIRRSALTFLALGALLAVSYSQAFDWFGQVAFDQCSWSDANGASSLSHSEAAALFANDRKQGKQLPAMTVSCSYSPQFGSNDKTLSKRGLTQTAEAMDKAVREEFGKLPYGGFEPGGVTTGHINGSAHYEGRAIDYFFRPYTSKANRLAGWQLAQWAVVHADELDIATVIFDDHIWQRNLSFQGWRPYQHPDGPTDNPIKRHLDHVHIDVR